MAPGLDNLAFDRSGRLFVSSFAEASVTEVTREGRARPLIAPGFSWPLGVTVSPAGDLFVADGVAIARVTRDGRLSRTGVVVQDGFPGSVRGLGAASSGWLWTTTALGAVARYDPAGNTSQVVAAGRDRLMGIHGDAGRAVVAEAGAGRLLQIDRDGEVAVLAEGLDEPMGVAPAPDGGHIVSEAGSGRVVSVADDGTLSPVLEGLDRPQGVAMHGDTLFVLDGGQRSLFASTLGSRERRLIASELPVGTPPGVPRNPGIPELAMTPGNRLAFADIAIAPDGTLFVSADGEGSVLSCRP